MSRYARLFSAILISGAVWAQAPATESLHPSNGTVQMEAQPIIEFERKPQSQEIYAPWAGLVEITMRNVSRGLVRLVGVSMPADFQVDITDISGKAVARTELGRRALIPVNHQGVALSVSLHDLVPLQEMAMKMDLARLFEIRPGQAYHVVIRRSRGIPKSDEEGKPIKDVELSCSFDVPSYGILRNNER